jgi:pimeloyl-ACP methyl ester carboxylesterase
LYLELEDGVPLYFERAGSGPTVVLVPGWTITTRFWQRQIADLSADHDVVTLDLRGAGNSGKTPDRHSLAAYGDDLRFVIETLELEDVTVVGWAMAVSVAVHMLAGDGCDRVARLVWVDHSPRFFATPEWQLGLFGNLTPADLDGLLHDLRHDRVAATRSLLQETMFATQLDEDELRWMVAELMKTPTEVAVSMLAAVAYADLRPLLGQLGLPVLVVNGGRSAVPPEVGHWLADTLPHGRSVVLPEAGHAPFWDDAEGFNEAVRAFVRERRHAAAQPPSST